MLRFIRWYRFAGRPRIEQRSRGLVRGDEHSLAGFADFRSGVRDHLRDLSEDNWALRDPIIRASAGEFCPSPRNPDRRCIGMLESSDTTLLSASQSACWRGRCTRRWQPPVWIGWATLRRHADFRIICRISSCVEAAPMARTSQYRLGHLGSLVHLGLVFCWKTRPRWPAWPTSSRKISTITSTATYSGRQRTSRPRPCADVRMKVQVKGTMHFFISKPTRNGPASAQWLWYRRRSGKRRIHLRENPAIAPLR